MWCYGITQSQYCNNDNNYNDDSVMCVNVWFEFFSGKMSRPMIYERETWKQGVRLRLRTSFFEGFGIQEEWHEGGWYHGVWRARVCIYIICMFLGPKNGKVFRYSRPRWICVRSWVLDLPSFVSTRPLRPRLLSYALQPHPDQIILSIKWTLFSIRQCKFERREAKN